MRRVYPFVKSPVLSDANKLYHRFLISQLPSTDKVRKETEAALNKGSLDKEIIGSP